ncbi:MAG: class II fumarate hydratase [Finegoldia sp.]|nr:class II fumarate hydratase [Finegoldia sp.]
MRIEKDSMGEIEIEDGSIWGAQSQRSLENFKIGTEKMPLELIRALVEIKRAAAIVNNLNGDIDDQKRDLIIEACDLILDHKYDDQFPLAVWQTGSGTQTNMNVNEVIANLSNIKAGQKLIHPNDDVNKSQSSNDTFPSAMHIALKMMIDDELMPELSHMEEVLQRLVDENEGIIKIGRTHLQDAVPLKLSQEISGWLYMIKKGKAYIIEASQSLNELTLGGTAVGTGLNAKEGFDRLMVGELNRRLGKDFKVSPNKFHSLTSKDAIAYTHGAMTALGANLLKIANDVRFLASGPRCGIGELIIPANEPGSSIMPGKVNPTQAEALSMVVIQVMGNDTTIKIAASQGNFELNTYMPLIIYNAIQSVRLLSDAVKSFTDKCLAGLKANRPTIDYYLNNSLMLVTALNRKIGYDKAAKISKYAYENNISLKEAAISLGILSEDEFNEYVDPSKMV